MSKKTIHDLPRDLTGKKVLLRLDLNVPVDETTGRIKNDRRIRAAVPTLQDLLGRGAAVIVMSHLGRPTPGGDVKRNMPFMMDRVAQQLKKYLNRMVAKSDQVVGDGVSVMASMLQPGNIFVLENLRFHPYEQPLKKDGATAEENAEHEAGMTKLAVDLAAMGDIYVNDAFGTLQNKDVSVLGLPKAMANKPRVIGLLVEKELQTIDRLLDKAERPMIGIMGGAKVSDKIKFIEVLLTKVDKLLIGGKLAYTFLKASNVPVGAMNVDYRDEELVKGLHAELWPKCQRPDDYLVAHKDNLADTKIVDGPVPSDYAGVDIGPKAIETYCREIAKAKTVIWNGPVGWFEKPPFDQGTRAIAEACAKLATSGGTVVVGGGETAEAVEEFGLADKMTHVSTGGGAFLKYVEDRGFKTLDALEDK